MASSNTLLLQQQIIHLLKCACGMCFLWHYILAFIIHKSNKTNLTFLSLLKFIFRSLCASWQSSWQRPWRRCFSHHESAHCSFDRADETRLGARPYYCVLLVGRLSPGKHWVLWMGKGQQAQKHLFHIMSAYGSEAVATGMTKMEEENDWKHNKWKWALVICVNIISQCSILQTITINTGKLFIYSHIVHCILLYF